MLRNFGIFTIRVTSRVLDLVALLTPACFLSISFKMYGKTYLAWYTKVWNFISATSHTFIVLPAPLHKNYVHLVFSPCLSAPLLTTNLHIISQNAITLLLSIFYLQMYDSRNRRLKCVERRRNKGSKGV